MTFVEGHSVLLLSSLITQNIKHLIFAKETEFIKTFHGTVADIYFLLTVLHYMN